MRRFVLISLAFASLFAFIPALPVHATDDITGTTVIADGVASFSYSVTPDVDGHQYKVSYMWLMNDGVSANVMVKYALSSDPISSTSSGYLSGVYTDSFVRWHFGAAGSTTEVFYLDSVDSSQYFTPYLHVAGATADIQAWGNSRQLSSFVSTPVVSRSIQSCSIPLSLYTEWGSQGASLSRFPSSDVTSFSWVGACRGYYDTTTASWVPLGYVVWSSSTAGETTAHWAFSGGSPYLYFSYSNTWEANFNLDGSFDHWNMYSTAGQSFAFYDGTAGSGSYKFNSSNLVSADSSFTSAGYSIPTTPVDKIVVRPPYKWTKNDKHLSLYAEAYDDAPDGVPITFFITYGSIDGDPPIQTWQRTVDTSTPFDIDLPSYGTYLISAFYSYSDGTPLPDTSSIDFRSTDYEIAIDGTVGSGDTLKMSCTEDGLCIIPPVPQCFSTTPPFIDLSGCYDAVGYVTNQLTFGSIHFGTTFSNPNECHTLGVLGTWLDRPNQVVCANIPSSVRSTVTPFVTFALGLMALVFLSKFASRGSF